GNGPRTAGTGGVLSTTLGEPGSGATLSGSAVVLSPWPPRSGRTRRRGRYVTGFLATIVKMSPRLTPTLRAARPAERVIASAALYARWLYGSRRDTRHGTR